MIRPNPYKTPDLFRVAKFIARAAGASTGSKLIESPHFLIALDFFKPLDDQARSAIPAAVQHAAAHVIAAYEAEPVLSLNEEVLDLRRSMDASGMEFELTDGSDAQPDAGKADFLRRLVGGMEACGRHEWESACGQALGAADSQAFDPAWAKDFAAALFGYLRSNPYKLYDRPGQADAPDGPAEQGEPARRAAPALDALRQAADAPDLHAAYGAVLGKAVLGQPLALDRFDRALRLGAWLPSRQGRPTAFLLAGPSATGKTTFVATLRDEWARRGGKHITIECASLSSYNEGFGLVGLRHGYDSAAPGRLTSFVREHPDALVILENVTQAHPNVQSLLIPMLDSGILADEYGFGPGADRGRPEQRDVAFAGATVVLTCTMGADIFEQPANLALYQTDPEALLAQLRDALRRAPAPDRESGRMTPGEREGSISPLAPHLQQCNLLPLRPLGLEALEQIALIGMDDMEQALRKHRIELRWLLDQPGEAKAVMARILALGCAPQFNPQKARMMACETLLEPWLSGDPQPGQVPRLDIALGGVDAGLLGRDRPAADVQREFFRRSERLAFNARVAAGLGRIDIADLAVERVAVRSDYRVEGGLTIEVPEQKFQDIYGHDHVKTRLGEVIRLLKNWSPKNELGLPRGMLLHGRPGTGKTMLAKALASEAGLPFIAVSGPQLMSLDTIRAIFRRARQYAPCLVFLDEIDALGVRGEGGIDPCINQLLTEIDGFHDAEEGPVFVIAATNYPGKVDPALTRSGRLDLCLEVPLLDRPARRHFLEKLQGRIELAPGEVFPMDMLLELSAGMSGADLEKLAREVRLSAIRRGQRTVTQADLLEELNVIKHGERNAAAPLQEQLRITAYHEAGHAMVSRALNPDVRIEQITIASRRDALGFTSYSSESLQQRNMDRKEVMDLICVALGGRVSQRHYMAQGQDLDADSGSDSGAGSDLEQATRLAWQAVTAWGLDEQFGWLATGRWAERVLPRHWEDLAAARVQDWLAQARKITEDIVLAQWPAIANLAERLMREETVLGDSLNDASDAASGG